VTPGKKIEHFKLLLFMLNITLSKEEREIKLLWQFVLQIVQNSFSSFRQDRPSNAETSEETSKFSPIMVINYQFILDTQLSHMLRSS